MPAVPTVNCDKPASSTIDGDILTSSTIDSGMPTNSAVDYGMTTSFTDDIYIILLVLLLTVIHLIAIPFYETVIPRSTVISGMTVDEDIPSSSTVACWPSC